MITNLKRSPTGVFNGFFSLEAEKCTENNKEMLGSYQSIYAGKPEIPDGNQTVRANLFGKLQKV